MVAFLKCAKDTARGATGVKARREMGRKRVTLFMLVVCNSDGKPRTNQQKGEFYKFFNLISVQCKACRT